MREIIRTAKDRHAGTQGYAEAMLLQYNKRLKYPLRWNSLHGGNATAGPEDSSDDLQISLDGGYVVAPGSAAGDDDEEFDEFDEEEVPDHEDALPNQTLMDNLSLKNSD